MAIVAAFMVPHPPMIVPDIGRGSEAQVEETTRAYEQVAEEIAALAPDTIIITSPHSVMYADYFHISPGRHAKGSFAGFGAPQVKFEENYDTELVREICRLADERDFPAGTLGERDKALDHGTMVPLWFIEKAYRETGKERNYQLVRMGLSALPLTDHYRMGQLIAKAIDDLDLSGDSRRVVLVASGDLSHKLQEYGPYGFAKEGPQYDVRIMDVCGSGAFGELFDFSESFCENAAECGHRSFVVMAGAFDGVDVEAKALSHQDVTGVGYGVCTFYPKGFDTARRFLDQYLADLEAEIDEKRSQSDEYVQLARKSLESYILKRERIDVPADLPEEMLTTRAGAFVSIHKNGALRGCIGTIGPTTSCVAQEIIDNAISASTRDPRFPPIEPDELQWLDINVDVLGEPEEIESKEELDVKRYGVIVSSVGKRGLLLPDLEGVDTVDQQIEIAKQKAGIHRFETVKLQRFEVIRHV
ncbi:MAG: AmmeMemoRadiSam system protein A [Firmicutes bacterium]|nr:AmmeMemoRadiSam system protein A [Bacillota bacterium]